MKRANIKILQLPQHIRYIKQEKRITVDPKYTDINGRQKNQGILDKRCIGAK